VRGDSLAVAMASAPTPPLSPITGARSSSRTAPDDLAAGEQVPPVVGVIVTCDPGWWLEDCLASLASQDYPELSVLVVDAGSVNDPTSRVGAVMSSAYVRRTGLRRGFGAAANEVLGVVRGASHYLLCHDDVVLDPDAVRRLVEEAFRSNAGIVAPKLVEWSAPERLLSAGMGTDHWGSPVRLVEHGELDQGQHDAVRDVFFAPAACSLVRADLFADLGGFDVGYGLVGEDLDLSWRAHLVGARVVVAPAARARHLEVTGSGYRSLEGRLVVTRRSSSSGPVLLGVAMGGRGAAGGASPAPGTSSTASQPLGADGGDHQEVRAATRGLGRTRDRRLDSNHARLREEARPDAPSPALGRAAPGEARSAPLDDRWNEARLRALAVSSSALAVLWRLPVLMALTLVEATVRLVYEGPRPASRPLRAWARLLRASPSVPKSRRVIRRARSVADREVTALQVGGATRLGQVMRSARGSSGAAAQRRRVDAPGPGWAAWACAVVVLAVGSRRLLGGSLPTIGELAPWPGATTLAQHAWSGWQGAGLGRAAPAPTAFALLALGGMVVLGHMALLQHVLILGMLPLGAIGTCWAARPLSSRRASLVALVVYLAVPLPYNALAEGRWSALVAYATAPWVIGILARASDLAPFGPPTGAGGGAEGGGAGGGNGRSGSRRVPGWTGLGPGAGLGPRAGLGRRSTARLIAALALVGALAGAIEPAVVALVVVTGVAIAVSAVLSGQGRAGVRAGAVAVGGAVGAAVLLMPWSIGWLSSTDGWGAVIGAGAPGARPLRLAALLRFDTGPLGAGPLGYALLAAGAVPLLVGRGWRSWWAVRLWTVVSASFALAWAAQHGALGIVWPPAAVCLAPAAAALALCAALGMAAFSHDLTGYRFGWRQGVSALGAVVVVVACTPVLAAVPSGRWHQPSSGFESVLSGGSSQRGAGDFRVLWLGSPDVLPIAGWRVDQDLSYATSRNGGPSLTDRWPGSDRGPTRLMAQAVTLARRAQTTDLGHLLAPMAVRYVVVVERPAPIGTRSTDARRAPTDLRAGLESQLDLRRVERSESATVYQNDAWAPARAQLSAVALAVAELDDPRAARLVDLASNAATVLSTVRGPTTFSGALPAGAGVEVAEAPSPRWQLTVGERRAQRQSAFGAVNLFLAPSAGRAVLAYRTPLRLRALVMAQAALWAVAVAVATRRHRHTAHRSEEGDGPGASAAAVVGGAPVVALRGPARTR